MTDDTIRDRGRLWDLAEPFPQDGQRRPWRGRTTVGLDLSRQPDMTAVTFAGGRRAGRHVAIELQARDFLAAGHRVFEASATEGLREITVDQAGQLVRGAWSTSIRGREGRVEFGDLGND